MQVAHALRREREILHEGKRLRPQQITATLRFTGIRGFTPISKRLGLENLLGWLNEYMDAMAATITRHGGLLKQRFGEVPPKDKAESSRYSRY
jgi:adenylate cyclase